jgi:hypothetical protein
MGISRYVTVIFIGRDPANRLDPAWAECNAKTGILEVVDCSPRCDQGGGIVLTPDPTQASGYAWTLSRAEGVRPAEAWVLRFANLCGRDPVGRPGTARALVGKQTIVLIDPDAIQP